MKHIVKIMTLLVSLSAVWFSLLLTSVIPKRYTWLLPLYFIVSLGCYGLLMVGVGLMQLPGCPQEAVLLQKDVIEAKDFLKTRGVDVVSNRTADLWSGLRQPRPDILHNQFQSLSSVKARKKLYF